MKSRFNPRIAGWLLAAALPIFAEAQAQNGFTVTRSRENVVAVGMTASEVQKLLGRPARAVRYRSTPGPIWTYRVADPLFGRTEFNVEFGADEKVIATGEIVIGSDSPNRGRGD